MNNTEYTTIVYDFFADNGIYLGRREYCPTDKEDYDRTMGIIANHPDKYKLINVDYGFEWKSQA